MNKLEQYESSMNHDQTVGIQSPSENGNGGDYTPQSSSDKVIGSLQKYMYPWVYNELKGGFIHNTPDGKSINHINQQVSPPLDAEHTGNLIMNSFQWMLFNKDIYVSLAWDVSSRILT